MRPNKKAEREKAKALAFLARHGAKQEVLEKIADDPVLIKNDPGLEAEAVLRYLRNANQFVAKLCKRCGSRFMTNYLSVAYCGDNCRAKALRELGIKWDPTLPPEKRWAMQSADGGRLSVEPPLLISEEAVQIVESLPPQTPKPEAEPVEEEKPQQYVPQANLPALPFDTDVPQ